MYMEFSRLEYWSGWPFPSPGDLPNPRIEPRSPSLQADSSPAEPQGKPKNTRVGCLSLRQWIVLIQESTWGLLHCRQILYQLSYQGSPWEWKIILNYLLDPKCNPRISKRETKKVKDIVLRDVTVETGGWSDKGNGSWANQWKQGGTESLKGKVKFSQKTSRRNQPCWVGTSAQGN